MSPGVGAGLLVGRCPPSRPDPAPLPSLLGTNFTLRELGLGEVTPPHGTLYRTDIGLPHCGYSMGASSEADLETDPVLSPEHPVQLWGRSTRSGRSSCLSSRANSNLTLTDTEHENAETGEWPAWPVPGAWVMGPGVLITVLIFCSIPWGSGEVGGKLLCCPSSKGRASRRVACNPRPWVTGQRRVAALSFQMRGVPKGQGYCLQGACAGGSRRARGFHSEAHPVQLILSGGRRAWSWRNSAHAASSLQVPNHPGRPPHVLPHPRVLR